MSAIAVGGALLQPSIAPLRNAARTRGQRCESGRVGRFFLDKFVSPRREPAAAGGRTTADAAFVIGPFTQPDTAKFLY